MRQRETLISQTINPFGDTMASSRQALHKYASKALNYRDC